jgi:hypothetical protein
MAFWKLFPTHAEFLRQFPQSWYCLTKLIWLRIVEYLCLLCQEYRQGHGMIVFPQFITVHGRELQKNFATQRCNVHYMRVAHLEAKRTSLNMFKMLSNKQEIASQRMFWKIVKLRQPLSEYQQTEIMSKQDCRYRGSLDSKSCNINAVALDHSDPAHHESQINHFAFAVRIVVHVQVKQDAF